MKRSDLKNLDLSNDEIREVITALRDGEDDFTVGNYRFIADDTIDEIQREELADDCYILGCFTAWAIADATGWPVALIEAAQKGEQFEAIGEAMTDEHIEALQVIYRQNDGYGHHFNRYDGNEVELVLAGRDFHAFRID